MEETKRPVAVVNASIEGFKRLVNVKLSLTETGLTVLYGKNMQGKTSIADAFMHGLIGPSYFEKSADLINHDADVIKGARGARSRLKFDLDDGTKIEVRLTDKNNRTGILDVTLPDGSDGSRSDINKLFQKASLNPPNLDESTERNRLNWLLSALDIDSAEIDKRIEEATNAKQEAYQEKEQARRAYDDLPHYPDAPVEEQSIFKLSEEYQQGIDTNANNKQHREHLEHLQEMVDKEDETIFATHTEIQMLKEELANAEIKLKAQKETYEADAESLKKEEKRVSALVDVDLEPIKERMANVETVNAQVRANAEKMRKHDESEEKLKAWRERDKEQEAVMAEYAQMVNTANNTPLPDIGVKHINGQWCATFCGEPWANMSGMQRKMFTVSVASLFNPNARLVIVDNFEALDEDKQQAFHKWLISKGLQSIALCVGSTAPESGDFVKLVIEDGTIKQLEGVAK